MKYTNNKGFSLIEVIVATGILTIAVFGVFKLIAENSKILTNSNNFIQANFLLQPTKECLNKIGLVSLKSETSPVYLDLGDNGTSCGIGTSTSLLVLDNIEYQIYAENIASGVDYIDWNIIIESNATGKLENKFTQK